MHSTGHTAAHAPQSIHASDISYFPSGSAEIAVTGQVPSHAPHEIQTPLSITYIQIPPSQINFQL